MVSNVVRCTRWKVITIILDKRDPYTQWYTAPSHFALYELLTQIFVKSGLGRVPLSVGVTFVKNDCKDLPLRASDHV